MIKSIVNYGTRERYQITKSFIPIIQGVGGFIFGGAVRDLILHDYAAGKFYQASMQTDEEGEALYSLFEHGSVGFEDCEYDYLTYPDILYQQEDYLPRLNDRFLVPNDIDCFMSTNSLEQLKSKLQQNNEFNVRIFRHGSLRIYIPDIDAAASHLKITRLIITHKLPKSIQFEIVGDPHFYIDVIHQENIGGLFPPFGNIDFECNSLLLTPTNDYIISPYLKNSFGRMLSPREKLDKVEDIIEDIEKKRAVVVSRVPLTRAKKMMDKDWEIVHYCDRDPFLVDALDNAIILTQKPIIDSKCSLCLDDFAEKDYRLKRPCCNAGVYHQNCWRDFMASNATKCCPLCRSNLEEFELSPQKTINLW